MKNFELEQSIGGYHALALPFFEDNISKNTVKTNSARSALKVILHAIQAKKIWLPFYTCDAVVDAVKDLNICFDFYNISDAFEVDLAAELGPSEYILIVDYFGVSSNAVKKCLKQFGGNKVIVDCSQAYFNHYSEALANIWSPRKFFGLPDGGLLLSEDSRVQQPLTKDKTSESRLEHLISRLTNSPERTYEQFLRAERVIAELPVLGMSELTERLLCSVDLSQARIVRAENFDFLHKKLGGANKLILKPNSDDAPLCYPLLPSIKMPSRADLISNKVFLPNYWPEVLARVEEGSFECELVTNGLFLPCDQRYTIDDMNKIVSLLNLS